MLFFATFIAIKLDESRIDNYTFPRVLAFKLVNLNAYIGVPSHDIQLLTWQSKCV